MMTCCHLVIFFFFLNFAVILRRSLRPVLIFTGCVRHARSVSPPKRGNVSTMWTPWRIATAQTIADAWARAAPRGVICHIEGGWGGRWWWWCLGGLERTSCCCGGMACRQCVPFHDGPLLGFLPCAFLQCTMGKCTGFKGAPTPPTLNAILSFLNFKCQLGLFDTEHMCSSSSTVSCSRTRQQPGC